MKLPLWGTVAAGVLLVGSGLVLALRDSPDGADAPAPPARLAEAADDAVQQALRAGQPTVAEFGAHACAACREMKPLLQTLAREHGARITVVNVDLIQQKEVNYLQRYRIQLMPTQVFFDAQGREIGRHLGKLSGDEILARLQGHAMLEAQVPGGTGPVGAPGSPL